jgi:hypothetical protein
MKQSLMQTLNLILHNIVRTETKYPLLFSSKLKFPIKKEQLSVWMLKEAIRQF